MLGRATTMGSFGCAALVALMAAGCGVSGGDIAGDSQSTPQNEVSAASITSAPAQVVRVYDTETGEWTWGITVEGLSESDFTPSEGYASGVYENSQGTTLAFAGHQDVSGLASGWECNGDWRFCMIDDLKAHAESEDEERAYDAAVVGADGNGVEMVTMELDGVFLLVKRFEQGVVECRAQGDNGGLDGVRAVCESMRDLVTK